MQPRDEQLTISPTQPARDRAPVDALLYILAAFAQMGMLGALLTFAPQQLYAAHAIAPLDWGFTPLADQQLGGLLMWVPAMLPYLGAGLWLVLRLTNGLSNTRTGLAR